MINDTEKNQTPSQDAQGRWYELLSPTQVLTNDDDEEQSIQTSTDDSPTEQVSQSVSLLSISQEKVLQHSRLNTMNSSEKDGSCTKKENRRQRRIEYLMIPDHLFVQNLSKTIEESDQISRWLGTKEKIDFIRQMSRVVHDMHYFTLQEQLWQAHYDLGLKEGWWGMELASSYAKEHRVCRAYSYQKNIIEERQMTANNELKRNSETLQHYLLQLETYAQRWQPPMDPYLLAYAIDQYVQNGQKPLRDELAYKKKMLQIDSNDHYLIRSFYWLTPNQEQIVLARHIWQSTHDAFQLKEQEEILRKRIDLRQLPSRMDQLVNQTMPYLQRYLNNPMMDEDRRTSYTLACSKLMTRYKLDLACLNLQIIQDIRRHYQTILSLLLKELSKLNWMDSIKQAIIDRQNQMVERYEIGLERKLNTIVGETQITSILSETMQPVSVSSSIDRGQINQDANTLWSVAIAANRRTWSFRETQSSIEVESNQPLSCDVDQENRSFHALFAKEVSAMIRKLTVRFPYRHIIQWSMHVDDQRQHDLNIEVRTSSRMN